MGIYAALVLRELHFEEHFISRTQRCNLKWQLNPDLTIYSAELLKSTLSLPTPATKRKRPTQIISKDEMQSFSDQDTIPILGGLNKNHAKPEFIFSKNQDFVVYHNLCFNEDTQFPKIIMSIAIDKELHIQ